MKYKKAMKEIVFATNNNHKIDEVLPLLNNNFIVLTLKEIACFEDIPETGSTLEENALLKARYINQKYGYDCFADDTGLEIASLNNEPGVFSARYAGEAKDSEANMNKVLNLLSQGKNRDARFRTVVALILDKKEYLFEGIINGEIIKEKKGKSGFGYDPIFVPDGYEKTFAEMELDSKNEISHRSIAIKKLTTFLKTIK